MAEMLPVPATSLDPQKPATMQASWSVRLIGLLEEQPLLEAAQEKLTDWLQPLVDWSESTGLKDVLHGRQIGHSLHPIATDLPIGFWTSAMLLDLVGAKKSADWTATHGRERRLGLLHGVLNLAGLACQTAALLSRRHYTRWNWIRSAIMTGTAYLGGELVYGRSIRVNHDAWTAGPAEWTPTCRLTDIPVGLMKGVQVEGRRVLLHRNGVVVTAMENACSHMGGPLDDGKVSGGVVTTSQASSMLKHYSRSYGKNTAWALGNPRVLTDERE